MLNIITNGDILPLITKPILARQPLILSSYKDQQKDLAWALCIQSLLSKNAIQTVEKVTSLGFYSCLFLVSKPQQKLRPVINLSRLNPFLKVDKFKMEMPEIHRGLCDSRGMNLLSRPFRCLPSHYHPPKLKNVPSVHPHIPRLKFTSLPSGWPQPHLPS